MPVHRGWVPGRPEHPPCFRGEQVSDQLSQIKKGDIQVSESIEPLLRFEIEPNFWEWAKILYFCSREGGEGETHWQPKSFKKIPPGGAKNSLKPDIKNPNSQKKIAPAAGLALPLSCTFLNVVVNNNFRKIFQKMWRGGNLQKTLLYRSLARLSHF